MRRILLGGFALGLGVFTSTAGAQQERPTPSQPQRAARLGQPVAVPDPAESPPEITPAGLIRRPIATGVPVSPPVGRPGRGIPVAGVPTVVVPPGGMVVGGYPTGIPIQTGEVPPPRPATGGTPRVTEDRGENWQAAPAVVVPSVTPQGNILLPGYGMDAPLYDGCPPSQAAVGRVAGFGRWQVSGEYLMWWTRAADLPVLATTSSPQFNGQIGVGDTRPLIGGDGFGQTFHSGFRVGAVRWFGDTQCRGIDARLFVLGQASSSATVTSGQYPLIARPFVNVNPTTPFFGTDSEIVAAPGLASGGVTVALENSLWGAEANYRRYLFGNPCARVDALVGYRYLNMNEQLQITEQFTRLPGSDMGVGVPALSGVVSDNFRAENHFHGGQIGLAGEFRRGRWSIDGRASVAFGNLNRTAEISGGQNFALANGTIAIADGGLLAIPGANIGSFSDNVFAVVPEVGVNIGYQLTSHLRVFVGYNFLYLSSALRAGDVVDPYVDAARIPNFLNPPGTPIPGTPRPMPQFRSAGFFAQGISFGLRYDW
ncbi:MAG TPA: BBP7 family outer membrane beta-barrel protein [Gemmata sp.]|nr:BBP7 family outer membrane beta-barrel protein [Gemmata sp.]